MLFSKPNRSIGIDIGSHSVKAVLMTKSADRLKIEQAGCAIINRNQLNVDPVMAHAEALNAALNLMPLKQSLLVGALPGQSVVIRYPRMRDMAPDQLGLAVEKEASQNIPYDLSEVFLDWAVLDRIKEGDEERLKVLLVAAKHEVIDSRVQIAEAAELQYSILSVDSLSLADAAHCCNFLRASETVALINTGAATTSIHFIKDRVSNFIRDVSWGSREMIQAIAKTRRCDFDEADRLLRAYADEQDAEHAPEAIPMAQEEPQEAVPEPLDLGGGSLLDPLEDEFGDLGGGHSAPSPASRSQAASGEKSIEEILVTPVSRLVSEIRRSFDYYEHQLYERPVDRIILSGGVAHVPILREALLDDLGVEHVEVAAPGASKLRFGDAAAVQPLMEHPAQFMVAIGLAARGTMDL